MADSCFRISKQRFVYASLSISTLLLFILTFRYIDLSDYQSLNKIRRVISYDVSFKEPIAPGNISAKRTISASTAKAISRKISTTQSSPKTSTSSTPTTSAATQNSSLRISNTVMNRSAKYPSHLNLQSLAKLSLHDLREKSKSYDVSMFPIPKIIHQSWKDKRLPPRFVKWSQSWKNCYPGWTYHLWTDSDNDLFIKNTFPWFYNRYNRLTHGVQKADAARYFYLFAHGGIYADLDDECLKPFTNLLTNHSIVFGAMSGHWFPKGHTAHLVEGYVQNSFMYSVPGHPLWLDVIETIMKRPSSSSAESTTGPFMLQEVIGKWRKKHHGKSDKVKIYPPDFFNPFSWIKREYSDCKDVNRMTSIEIEKCKAHYPMAYVIQYHTQTWGRGAGKTFRNDR